MANALSQLRWFLVERYDLNELETLCFDLGIRFDDLGGEGRSGKARELLLYLGRRGQVDRLLDNIQGDPDRGELFEEAGFSTDRGFVAELYLALHRAEQRRWWRVPAVLLFAVVVGAVVVYAITRRSPERLAHPNNLVNFFDFENSAAGWEDVVVWDNLFMNPQTYRGAVELDKLERGAAYSLRLKEDAWIDYTIQYADPVKADVIVADFFLPNSADIRDNWVGIAAVDGSGGPWLAGSGQAIPPGKWTRIVLDLRGQYDGSDIRINERSFFIQIVYIIQANSTLQSDIVLAGLDDVAWYQAAGGQSIHEQRGPSRALWDFEDEWPGGWKVISSREQTDALSVSSEPIYRGFWALRWDMQLEGGGENALIEAQWFDGLAQGIWVAHLFLPNDVPAETDVWANFWTRAGGVFDGPDPQTIRKGMWNTLVWDTRDVEWSQETEILIGIQVGAEGGSYQGPIYVDDIQILER